MLAITQVHALSTNLTMRNNPTIANRCQDLNPRLVFSMPACPLSVKVCDLPVALMCDDAVYSLAAKALSPAQCTKNKIEFGRPRLTRDLICLLNL